MIVALIPAIVFFMVMGFIYEEKIAEWRASSPPSAYNFTDKYFYFKDEYNNEDVYRINTAYKELEQKKKIKNIEYGLVRICQTLRKLANDYGCSNPNSVYTVWDFLDINNKAEGYLSDIYSYPKSSTFSCNNIGNYGRYLLTNTFSQDYVKDIYYYFRDLKGYTDSKFNFDDSNQNPCLYGEFVFLKSP